MIEKKYLLLLLIGFFVVIILFLFGRQKVQPPINETFCDQIRTNLLNNACRAMVSKDINKCDNSGGYDIFCFDVLSEIINPSVEMCDSINSNYGKLMCYNSLAIKTKDPKFCMNNDDCYLKIASITSNTTLCDFFSDKSSYYTCLAVASNDRGQCKNIENVFEEKLCLSNLPQGLEDCLIEGNYDYACLSILASKEKNSTICETIDNDYIKFKCILSIKNDFEICKASEGVPRDICIIYYLKNELSLEP
jgi:hypothetical protein